MRSHIAACIVSFVIIATSLIVLLACAVSALFRHDAIESEDGSERDGRGQ